MLIYKKNDKVSVQIDEIEVKISPLTHAQKTQLQAHMMKAVKGDMDAAMDSVRLSVKFALKDIKGVQYIDEDGVSYNDQIGNAVIINETDTTSWAGSPSPAFPIDSQEDDSNYPNNTATTNPYFGTPGEIFFTMDPIGSGSDGTYSGALSDIYKIKRNFKQKK